MVRFLPWSVLLVGLGCISAAAPENATSPTPEETAQSGAWERAKPARPGADWPRFLGPNDDGSSPETGILTKWPADGLRKVWETELGIGFAPPAIVDGKLFHFDRYDDQCRLTCRNAATGEFLWKFEYPTDYEDMYGYDPGPRCGPVVDGERVYCYGPEGMLYCVGVADGKAQWKLDTREKYHFHQNFFGVGSAPLVHGDLLIIAVGGSPKGPRPFDFRDAKGNGTGIVALDKKTGEVRYTLSDELASYSSPITTKIGERTLGLYFARGGLLGFDPTTGKEAFHYPWRATILESVNAANPVVVGDSVLVTECYEEGAALLKVPDTGKPTPVWTDAENGRFDKSLEAHWCTPIVVGKYVYGSSGRHANEADLRCVELATGEVQWKERRTTRCTFLKIDGHILSLGENAELRLFKPNPEKYEEVARWENPDLPYPCWAPPAVSRSLLYLRGKGKLAAYELIPIRPE